MDTAKVIEVVGSSKKDWSDAVQSAVAEACRGTNVKGVEVINWTAKVEEGKIKEYKANVKVAYLD